MTDSTRAAFEAWARTAMPACDISMLPNSGGAYNSIVLEARWTTWQAARLSALEEAAKVCSDNRQIVSGSPGPLFDAGWTSSADHCTAAIRQLAAEAGKRPAAKEE